MMLKFLSVAYPISRVKHDNKFKRAYILDNGVYILSDESSIERVKNQLCITLCKVFFCDKATALAVLDNFLNIKK